MTFVVAMFAATVALVSFGYVATREWRSGTNLLLERRANEALALVRAALSADMKGAWITAIVPFNTDGAGRGSAVRPLPGRRPRVRHASRTPNRSSCGSAPTTRGTTA